MEPFSNYFWLTDVLPSEIALISASAIYIVTCVHSLCELAANAKVAGMSADLNLVGLRYNIAAAVFFVCIYVNARLAIIDTCQGSVLSC